MKAKRKIQRLSKVNNHKHKQISQKTEKTQIIKNEVFYDFTIDSHEIYRITSKYFEEQQRSLEEMGKFTLRTKIKSRGYR